MDRPCTPADDVQTPQTDQADNGQNENFRNPSKKDKCKQGLLKDDFNNLGGIAGKDLRRLWRPLAANNQSFSGVPIISKTIISATGFKTLNHFQAIHNQISKQFQQNPNTFPTNIQPVCKKINQRYEPKSPTI